MKRWCTLTDEIFRGRGRFTEARLVTLSGRALHTEDDFVHELAQQLMYRYEGQPFGDPLVLEEEVLDRPDRTRVFYRHIIDQDGKYKDEFCAWASETLATWLEETLGSSIFVRCNPPHSNDPVYDVITIVHDEGGTARLRLVQVKATRDGLQRNCNEALDGFSRLESGRYQPHLWNRLRSLKARSDFPPGLQARELLYDPQMRYRVTAVHHEDRDSMEILTTYDEKVPGQVERRSACRIHVQGWIELWGKLAEVVYQHLT